MAGFLLPSSMGTSDWWGDMMAHYKTTGFAVICGSILAVGLPLHGNAAAQGLAATPTEGLAASGLSAGGAPVEAEAADMGVIRADGEPRGNPLWAMPLESLKVTRERPIFLPSRRPPAPQVVASPAPAPVQPSPPQQAEPLRLQLIGAVAGTSADSPDIIALFRDTTTKDVVRLRTGEAHAGWILRSVKGREATVEKGRERIRLALASVSPSAAAARSTAPVPSPPLLAQRASDAMTVPGAADESTGLSLPPSVTRAPPAVDVPSHPVPPGGSVAPPAIAEQAPPAVDAPSHPVPPGGSVAPPAIAEQAPPATSLPPGLLPPGLEVFRPQ